MFQKVTRSRILKKATEYAKKSDDLRSFMQSLSDDKLKEKTVEFKDKLSNGASIDSISVEAFAVVREAAKRVCGLEPYFVQLVSGFVLLWGNISEQYTGEGKSLVAALPSYVMGLTGKGVHIVTVNDYLASRDAKWIGDISRWLGLSVGCILSTTAPQNRKAEYDCDITYITNNELGFDYLRDNMVPSLNFCVQRGFHYAIIDEADSVLIDEARTPLIVSNNSGESTELYSACDAFVKTLVRGESDKRNKMNAISGIMTEETGDYIVEEKDKMVHLTESGVNKMNDFFSINGFSGVLIHHHVIEALKAHSLMFRDRDYIVNNGCVHIVDEFTGRVMPDRRYSDGLHQAIEAKEHVEIQQETRTMATITFQNLFNKYELKSGMTGTALTEADEFWDIYSMRVVCIPTNKPVIREDLPDVVFLSKKAKYKAVVNAVKDAYSRKQPVLVGTTSIEISELLSDFLKSEGIQHRVLNAKNHAVEAEIVAHAGEYGSVTIATNMAGRGTDIVLDEKSRLAGGLFVIGTERHEARRIDNQLRGRSGRQGDPGKSQFFISLEDDVIRLFGSEKAIATFKAFGFKEDDPIIHRRMSRLVENAQKHIEENNFGIRRQLMKIDEVNNQHREIIYNIRRDILKDMDAKSMVRKMIFSFVSKFVDENDGDFSVELSDVAKHVFGDLSEHSFSRFSNRDELISYLNDVAIYRYLDIEKICTKNGYDMRYLERRALLVQIDRHWPCHLSNLEQLQQCASLAAYGQRDPVVAYKVNAYEVFDDMLDSIASNTLDLLFTATTLPSRKSDESAEFEIVVKNDVSSD